MKKFVALAALFFAVGISFLLFHTSANQKINLLLQKFFPSSCNDSLLLVGVDDDFLAKGGIYSTDSEKFLSILNESLLLSRELGAKSFLCDFNNKNPLVKIDSLVQKKMLPGEKQLSIFGIKILIPWRKDFFCGLKCPELENFFFPLGLPLTSFKGEAFLAGNIALDQEKKQLLVKKNGEYFSDPALASCADWLGVKKIRISEKTLFLDCDGRSVKIPCGRDASVLLKFPAEARENYRQISFVELYDILKLEEKLFDCISIMEKQGLFGEFEGENPVELYALCRDSKDDFESYRSYKKKFYSMMTHYLSGRQERLLLEALSSEEDGAFIRNMFSDCRKIFSELETLRAKAAEKLSDSLCVFALTASLTADFAKSPFEQHFPRSLESYVLAGMILSEDFFDKLPLLYAGIAAFLLLVFILSLTLALCLVRKSILRRHISDSFLQCMPVQVLKKIASKAALISTDGEKLEISVLSLSIREGSLLRKILTDGQFVAFVNYYFEKISAVVLENFGLIESYRDDLIFAIFGAPIACESHCLSAVKAALAAKEKEESVNADILTLPQSPKPDGMNDDLYTAFFILNHNGFKFSIDAGIWTGEGFCACMGSEAKKSYRIADETWRKALEIKNCAEKFECKGVLLNEETCDSVKNAYIIRKLESDSDKSCSAYEILDSLSSDDDRLWNYANYWNQAVSLLEKGEREKSLAIFKKLSEGRPSDKTARYFIKCLNNVE